MEITPYYDHDGITIYCGDCRDIVPELDCSGALVLADPPYGIAHPTDYKSRGRGGRDPRGVFVSAIDYAPVRGDEEPFDPGWLLQVGKARVLWGANYYASKLPDVSGWLVWDKIRGDDLDQATCELAWTDVVKGVRRFRHRWDGMIRDSERGGGKLVHPTQKPVALMTWCMSLRWTRGFDFIVDPYMGSGPVLRAAKDLGKRAIGIEISEEYCKVAVDRLRQQTFCFGSPEKKGVLSK